MNTKKSSLKYGDIKDVYVGTTDSIPQPDIILPKYITMKLFRYTP